MDIPRLMIESLIPGIQNCEVIASVSRISEKAFKTEKAEGKLMSITLADETGSIRITLWNDEIEKARELGIKEGDAVRVAGYVRQGLYGPELRLGRFGKLEVVSKASRRAVIAALKEGQRAEIRAAIVQLFENSPFYEVCPKCGFTVKEENEKPMCKQHGEVEPDYALKANGVLDDGTETIRFVAFREQAEAILGITPSKAKDIVLRKGLPALFATAKYGEFVLKGNVHRNKFFDRIEFIVNEISPVDVEEEIAALEDDEKVVEDHAAA